MFRSVARRMTGVAPSARLTPQANSSAIAHTRVSPSAHTRTHVRSVSSTGQPIDYKPSNMMDVPLDVCSFAERAADLFPETEIVSQQPDKSLVRHTYKDLNDRSRQLARGLLQNGLESGDCVATLMWNNHAHVEVYFGAPLAGGLYHTLNLRLSPDDLSFIVNDAKDKFLIVDESLLPLVDGFIHNCPTIEKVYVVPHTPGFTHPKYALYDDLLRDGSRVDDATWERPAFDERQAIGLCYTSGTTGRPKGVSYSHRALALHSIVELQADVFNFSHDDTILPVVPMFHANAWGLPFATTLVGAKNVLPGPHLDPASLLDLYEKENVTISAGVPTIWIGILQALEANPERWNIVSEGMRMIVGGSAVPESTIERMAKFKMEVIQAWGMTEISPLGTLSRVPQWLDVKLNDQEKLKLRASQGYPAALVDLRVQGDDGVCVTPDGVEMGEIQVRGPWVVKNYYNRDESETRESFTSDGWFRTGDIAVKSPHGYVQIVDRTKDVVKSGGEWISSVLLENSLMSHPAVAESAVVAVPHPKWDERPLAIVVFKDKAAHDNEETRESLREHLLSQGFAKWQLPDEFQAWDEIPKTSTGKIHKLVIRQKLGVN